MAESTAEFFVLHVNGTRHEVRDAWLGESLLFVLRERLGLLGAKGACEQGECGSCSVLVDGDLVCSCLVLAAGAIDQADGIEDAGDEVAQQQRRHHAVELLPEALERSGPEHQRQGGGDQAEQDDVVLDQRGGWFGGFDRHRQGSPGCCWIVLEFAGRLRRRPACGLTGRCAA